MTAVTETHAQANPRPSDALGAAELLELLERMLVIRHFEERAAQAYQQAKIGGFCHLYIGQEATAVGSLAALRDDDPVITAYRDHGHALARGMHPNYAMAELFGKVTGCAKGKGGSMHYFDRQRHFYGGHAIVGGQCPLGVGLAFAIQYEKKDNVCLCFLGDGALNQGAFHESMNLAAIWRLPIIFVCENNLYSMGTSIARGTSMAEDLSVKAAAYGMTYAQCDGMNVLETYDTFKPLVDRVRGSRCKALGHTEDSGGGPAFVNCRTYRYKGHSMSDPQKYRSKEEVAHHEEHRDPINHLVNHLIDRKLADQSAIDELDRKAKKLALEAVRYASESPDLPVEELYTDVYANPYGPYRKGELPVMCKDQSSDRGERGGAEDTEKEQR